MKPYLGIIGMIPFVVLFVGLVGTKFKSYVTGTATLAVASLLAFFAWHTPLPVIGFAALEGVCIAILPILWVIFAAIFTYHISVETGAMDVIKARLKEITPDLNVQAVLIAFCLGGFLESVAGFGTAVAIPTAMLMSMGFHPVRSAVISLVANSVPVAFGALGIPVIVLSKITALDLALLTKYVAIQLAPFAFLVPLALLFLANGGVKGLRRSVWDTLFIGIIFTVVQTAVALFVGPELVAVAGSLSSLGFYALYRRLVTRTGGSESGRLAVAVINYVILLVLVLATRLPDIHILKEFPFVLKMPIGTHTFTVDWLTTPGTLLIISAIAGGMIQGLAAKSLIQIMGVTARKIVPSALTIISIVALAKVMGYSGMILSVAGTLTAFSGSFYPLIAPVLGALGTFVTGSDTSSNILLGELQKNAAVNTGYSPEWIAASNTAGATAGKMISPQSISVAASTVGITQEREIIRTTIWFCLGYAVILGIYIFIAASLMR
jgi:lactate permease